MALRYLRPRRTFVSVITVISVIGVLLGVAVMIVVIAVMSGFDKEWRDRILGFNAHLKVYNADLSRHDKLPGADEGNPGGQPRSRRRGPVYRRRGPAASGADANTTPTLSPAYVDGIDAATQAGVTVLPTKHCPGKI